MFDIVHPAHALFFHHAIERLRANGDEVMIVSREKKDITTLVLDRLGHEHRPISAARSGAAGMFLELGLRDLAMLRVARSFKPHVMVGFGGISISHVGWLCRIPSMSFYDTEIAKLQIGITLPFITEWHVPETYTGPVPRKGLFRFPGTRHLAYFHPDNFRPDRDRAMAAGLDPERDNFLIRTVGWSANHDIGKSGLSGPDLIRLATRLSEMGRVHISAEDVLPPELEGFRYRGDVLDLHHLMAHCRAYVGESATMAAEAAVLGVPAIYAINDYRGFIDHLAKIGLVIRSDGTVDDLLRGVDQALARSVSDWRELRDEAATRWTNVSSYVYDAIDRYRPQGRAAAA
ncbi:DUF354 domain-containing protein [Aquibium sp. LZ166]|uniref:DUF354 domain-containing protein n=1 Tax=Aquibium pacificus TaxID=3153579 RepID=A0ABV3SE22_9HYPH